MSDAPLDLFQDRVCRLCKDWAGDVEHVRQQVPALCRARTRLHAHPRTYSDDTCASFRDAGHRPGHAA